MKRAGEFVLMNGRRSVHPKQKLDVKSRMAVNNDLWLAEFRIGLKRLIFAEQEISHERGQIHLFGRRPPVECCPGDLGKLRERKILAFPTFQHRTSELCEKCIHSCTLSRPGADPENARND